MHIDGDGKFPTICGTGTEDYFCGSYGFPEVYTTAYVGNTLDNKNATDGGPRKWSLYRWHIMDPIYFKQDLRMTIQALDGTTENRVATGPWPMILHPLHTGTRWSRTIRSPRYRRLKTGGHGRQPLRARRRVTNEAYPGRGWASFYHNGQTAPNFFR